MAEFLDNDSNSPLPNERIADKVYRTKNNMGVMLEEVGKFDGEFLDAVRKSPKRPMKILDLGVAYGFTTKELLKTGADVTANDLSEEHLKHLWKTVSEEERTRLQLMPGNAVDLEFPAGSFDGIMACRWFNFLTGDEVRKVLEKLYNWLMPGGSLCVTAESIHSAWFVNAYDKYVKAKESSSEDEWPGMLHRADMPKFKTNLDLPESVLFFDVDTLKRELGRAGFTVGTIGYESRYLYTKETQNDGREGVGAIATKPL